MKFGNEGKQGYPAVIDRRYRRHRRKGLRRLPY
jgi:hypothetical protein